MTDQAQLHTGILPYKGWALHLPIEQSPFGRGKSFTFHRDDFDSSPGHRASGRISSAHSLHEATTYIDQWESRHSAQSSFWRDVQLALIVIAATLGIVAIGTKLDGLW